ncbi:MAG: hypothetical protein ACLS29_05505 [Prevotellamassilia sp.]
MSAPRDRRTECRLVALGMALATQRNGGSLCDFDRLCWAVVPAVAEAYYRRIPCW